MAANIQGRDPLEDGHYPQFIPKEILRSEEHSLRSDLDDRTKSFLDDPFIRDSFFSWAHNHSRDIQDNPRLQEMFKYISHPPVKREAATSLISRTNTIATPVLEKSNENSDAERPVISPTTSPPSPSHKEPTAIIREEITSSERFRKIMDRYTEEGGIMVAKKGKISSQLTRSQLEEVVITAIKTAKEMRALGHWESAKSFEVAGLTFEVITSKEGSESLTILSSNHKYLGGGHFGSVMRAFSISGGQFRAIKKAEESNPESQESLQKEYVVLKHLGPMGGIPRPPRIMHHLSESSRAITGLARLRHEYIDGMTMEQVEQSTMSIPEKCRIAKQLLNIVMQMHEKGVAHGDIHLGNIMLSGDKIIVIDFGAAAIHSETSPEDFYNKDISDTLWLISYLFGSRHPLHNIAVEAHGLKEALALIEKESEKYEEKTPKREVETTRRETTSVSIAETSDDTEEIRRSPSFLKVMDRYREMDGLMVSKKDNIALNLTKPQLEEALIKAFKISKEMRAAGRWETVQSFEVAGHTFEVLTGKSGSDHISIYIKNLSRKLGAGKFGTVQKVFSITGGDFRAEKAGHEFETRSLAKMENEYLVLHHMGPTEGVIHPPKRIHVVSGSSDKPVVLSRISTKLIEGSALSDTIERLQEEDVSVSLDVARQIIQIMLRLKEKGVAHNDIHSGNIMVNFDSSDNPHVTLIDFGEAMIRTPGLNPIQIKGFHLRDLDQTCGLFKRIFIKGDALYDIGNLAGSLEEALALVDAEIAKSSST